MHIVCEVHDVRNMVLYSHVYFFILISYLRTEVCISNHYEIKYYVILNEIDKRCLSFVQHRVVTSVEFS